MAFITADRVREVTTSVGTGNVTPSGAYGGYQTFAAGIGAGNSTYYTISLDAANEWEVGIGTYVGPQFTRDTVLSSSNGNALVNFSAGSKEIFCTLPAERAVYNNPDGSLVYDPAGSAIIYAVALG
jgi:hypothetical protein